MNSELRLAVALADLADAERTPGPHTPGNICERLGVLARYARDVLAADGLRTEVTVLLWDACAGARSAAGHSGRGAATLHRLEFDRGEGPTVEALRTGRPSGGTALDGPAPPRWPVFAAQALAAGVRRVVTLPLRHQGRSLGVLSVYQYQETAVPRRAAAVVQALADACTTALAAQGHAQRAEQLQRALDSRVVLEQAKGILAERRLRTLDEAFSLLRGYARSHRRSLRDTARAVVDGALTEPPFHRGPRA
ncbi:GAF and ANTAR domain-containing protein [Streptomyces sp. CRN 30]|uniref:GAF and ANTAR domain-containing protein n=1 Tax=Streptomyces sp. CRN 30 TaxID=3075613 RepID=UPI002A7F58CB|nr:GAF and ANTAR domain-containing protein [Streptomyces sp. CRN 30]